MRMTFTVSAEQGIALLDLGRVYLTVDERVLRLRAVTKEGPTMTLEFEEDWSTVA